MKALRAALGGFEIRQGYVLEGTIAWCHGEQVLAVSTPEEPRSPPSGTNTAFLSANDYAAIVGPIGATRNHNPAR